MIRMTVLGILCWVHAAAAGTHSLQYFAVGTTEETGIPKYVEVDMVDGMQYMYYDSTMEKPTFRMDWINKTMGPDFWERRIQYIELGHNMVKSSLSKTVQHFNHTGVHIYQSMGGCELDADGTRRTYASHAYDGKDFVSLDLETMTWIAALPQAVYYKRMRKLTHTANRL
ncbi:major histocompatibility complex class I-related gene protein-like isoform X1 [Acipenser oxyrinchus oxyrinchus]|uniref:Major histocompatibility complex class I-related gene protein-like isoform X1 n=1 Tax=Acipenser oxyrinchus oxyrinchus TaxID=40147 RepID=A0AAD8CDN7_ACIOX|nr:major histocompatibility complex class I-related gene protein-like isoform X1 [Acipenser oxyrinchus oxyrinchus]